MFEVMQMAPAIQHTSREALRRMALALAAALCLALGAAFPALAADEGAVKLFKLITPKDEIVVGITGDELRSFGPAADLDNFAQHLGTVGEMTVWQYAVKHGTDGALQQAPLKRVAIFKNEALRIEPFNPAPLPV